ncbi:DAK2 domain-containing protein [Aeromicrobium camelliae]|uniref:DAK2 domain-containing protein n=1 Tax=Aeromicrobium camelliae TaxID=1538144 RepID=A0A3N6ZPA7_9ACTN|nr:DAK2 domain-containing protein [Aeromicrobium camelliae]RQN08897.1 DAK2 domain-containing protein [Aeromicrobium camelliae]
MTHAIQRATAAALGAHVILTEYDQLSGDGDFGDNLCEGLQRAVRQIDARPHEDPFAVTAQVFLDEVGGTSGPLLGLLFNELAKARASGDPRWLSTGLEAGAAAIQRVGEAQRGDRTLLDALVPAAEAAKADIAPSAVADVALRAALDTAAFTARRGRSSYVGARALGVPDPGAVGIAILLWSIAHEDIAPEAAGAAVTALLPRPASPLR